jgi:hypothetical protein
LNARPAAIPIATTISKFASAVVIKGIDLSYRHCQEPAQHRRTPSCLSERDTAQFPSLSIPAVSIPLFLEQPEVMLCMLVTVLGFDRVAG